MIDAFGTGFDRTFKVCAQNGIEYEYQNDEYGFTFIFKRNDKINELDKEIIQLISKNVFITIPELAETIGKSEVTIYRHLNVLVEKNVVERIGSRKRGYWNVRK